MTMKCPVCNRDVTPTENQIYRKKRYIGYQPTCRREECRLAMVKRGGFN